MTTTGPNDPTIAVNVPYAGYIDWTNPTYVYSFNGYSAGAPLITSNNVILACMLYCDNLAEGHKIHTIPPNNKYATLNGTGQYYQWGSSTDLWGLQWSPYYFDDASLFTVSFVAMDEIDADPFTANLDTSGFGFHIPWNSTIRGILVEPYAVVLQVGGTKNVWIDHVRVSISYDLLPLPSPSGSAYGGMSIY
jgi:hypothetical protein